MNSQPEMHTIKIAHLALNADEELSLAKAMCNHMEALSKQPRSLERDNEMDALASVIQKIRTQLSS